VNAYTPNQVEAVYRKEFRMQREFKQRHYQDHGRPQSTVVQTREMRVADYQIKQVPGERVRLAATSGGRMYVQLEVGPWQKMSSVS
jgi:hypothetical protein